MEEELDSWSPDRYFMTVPDLSARCRLLAVNTSFKTNTDIVTSLPLRPHELIIELHADLDRPELVFGLHPFDELCGIDTVISISFACRRLTRSRATVSSVKSICSSGSVELDGAAGGLCVPFFYQYSAIDLFDTPWAVALAIDCSTCRCRSGSSRFHVRRAARDRRDRVSRRLLVSEILRQDFGAADRQRHRRRGVFFCFMFSWVELLRWFWARSHRWMPSRFRR